MNPALESLSLFTEQKHFVEYLGDLYYVGDNLEEMKSQGFEFEEGDIEETTYINSRRNVGCAPLEPTPYVEGFNLDEQEAHKYDGVRVIKEGYGILPDPAEVIIRRIKNPSEDYGLTKPDHVIFRNEDDHYYCMSNNCDECDVEPVRVPATQCVISADISAQEPMASTIVTREPKWAEVFELKNFRMDESLLQYLDIIFESYLKISKREVCYVQWVHDTFFYDQTEIYKLNYLVNECKVNEGRRSELGSQIDFMINSFTEHKEKGKK